MWGKNTSLKMSKDKIIMIMRKNICKIHDKVPIYSSHTKIEKKTKHKTI